MDLRGFGVGAALRLRGVGRSTRHTVNAFKDLRDNSTVSPDALRVGFILPESGTRLTLIVAQICAFGSIDHVD